MGMMIERSRAFKVAARAALLVCFLVCCGSLSLLESVGVHAFSSSTPIRCSPHIQIHSSSSSSNNNMLGFSSSPRIHSGYEKPKQLPRSVRNHYCPLTLESSSSSEGEGEEDKLFDAKTTVALVGGQSVLIVIAAVAAHFTGTPNYGLGPGIDASLPSIAEGFLWSLPLGLLAVFLDFFEERFPALQEVTKATHSSVLSLLGGTFKPFLGVLTALALGAAAGIGEEMLFRGVLQFELGSKLGSEILAVGLTSVVFGALHAVTPLYAGLAALASVYFGWLYLATGNLVVPIITHAFYDWAALLYAHWTVTNMSDAEQQSLLEWRFGGSGEGGE